MIKKRFSNGLRLVHRKTDSEIVVVNISVQVGSDHEDDKILGISHLIEHLVFEGTKRRTCMQISNEIESLGGELNAYTSSEKTCFYIKIDKRHARKAFDILSDIIINPLFDDKTIKKEKNVVLEEIKMVNDDPRQYQWVYHIQKLFSKPFNNPTYGTVRTVKNASREMIVNHYTKYYRPSNIVITVVGDVDDSIGLVDEFFLNDEAWNYRSDKEGKKAFTRDSRCSTKVRFTKYRPSINHSYMIIGYPVPTRLDKASLALDLVWAIMARGQSGKLFDEIRTKRGLTYDLGIIHNPGVKNGIFAFYSSASNEKINTIREIYFSEIKKLLYVSDIELAEAKSFISGNMTLKMEDMHYIADTLSFYEECGDCSKFERYRQDIDSITKDEIISCIKRYLLDNRHVETLIIPTAR